MQLLGKLPRCSGFVPSVFFWIFQKMFGKFGSNEFECTTNFLWCTTTATRQMNGWVWGPLLGELKSYQFELQFLETSASQPSPVWSQSLWARFSGHWTKIPNKFVHVSSHPPVLFRLVGDSIAILKNCPHTTKQFQSQALVTFIWMA